MKITQSERSDSRLKPKFPRLQHARRVAELDAMLDAMDDVDDVDSMRHHRVR